jgi:hypothetical protein
MPHRIAYISTWIATGLAAVAVVGCNGAGAVPVEGRVSLNGQPLANASVMLSPTTASGPGPFVGTTDAEGKFVLGPAGKEGGGAAPGEYTVLITTVKSEPREDAPLPTQREVVPAGWRNGSERFTIPAEGTKEANFEMKGG